jgi:hypothetical protein
VPDRDALHRADVFEQDRVIYDNRRRLDAIKPRRAHA